MFRLEVDQDKGELSFCWLNDKKEEQKVLVNNAENKLETNQEISRAKIVESGLIPSSAVFKQTKKATLEYNDGGREHIVTIECTGEKGEFSWPKEWDFRLTEGGVTETFRAPTPDCVLAYEYYFNLVKKEILQHQLNLKNFGFPSQPAPTGLF